jgi:hypothetical protein
MEIILEGRTMIPPLPALSDAGYSSAMSFRWPRAIHRQSTNPTEVNPAEIIDSVLAFYHAMLRDAQITVVREYKKTPQMRCYSSELRQVFANLIGDAFDATRRGGTISVRIQTATASGDCITIADTGHGMSRETSKRIFEPFLPRKVSMEPGWNSGQLGNCFEPPREIPHPQLQRSGHGDLDFLPAEPCRWQQGRDSGAGAGELNCLVNAGHTPDREASLQHSPTVHSGVAPGRLATIEPSALAKRAVLSIGQSRQ